LQKIIDLYFIKNLNNYHYNNSTTIRKMNSSINNQVSQFEMNPLLSNVSNVIQSGLKKIWYDITHQSLHEQLEFYKSKVTYYENELDNLKKQYETIDLCDNQDVVVLNAQTCKKVSVKTEVIELIDDVDLTKDVEKEKKKE